MKSQKSIKSILLSLVLPIVTALALIGLTGCTIIIGEEPAPPGEPLAEQPPEEGPPPSEVHIAFTADRTELQPGECAILEWSVEGGFGVDLNEHPVERSGQMQVCPEETTPYWLGVDTGETMERREVMIFVAGAEEPPPLEEHPPEEQPPEGEGVEFVNLVVEPDVIPAGACAMLFWVAIPPGEWPVLLNGQEVPHVGEQEVCPGDTTTYELLVEAPGGPEERVVTLHVEGEPEPEPGQPPEPTPASPAGPTSTPVSPAGPTPPPGVVIDFWVDNNNIAAGTCTTLRWHVANANAVHLDGAGVVGDGSKQICPSSTTVYVLHVAHDAGATEKKVTVKVSGGSSSQPQSADLAVTDLFADKLVQGKVYARVTNHGPGNLTNVTVQLSCSGAGWANNSPTPVSSSKSVAVTLNPGQTQQFNTGIVIDTNQYSYYELTCEINYQDRNSANNSHGEVIP